MRRGWVVALGAGLFSSLLPGCHLPQSASGSLPDAPQARVPKSTELAKADEGHADYAVVPDPPKPVLPGTSADHATPVASKSGPSNVPLVAGVPVQPVVRAVGNAQGAMPAGQPETPDLEGPVKPRIPIAEVTVGPVPHPDSEEPSENYGSSKMPEPPLLGALRCYLEKKPREALDHLAKFDKLNQELLICLLPLAVQLAEAEKPSERQSAMAVEQLESVMYGMRTRAPLLVEKMCLCQSIKAFGVYEEMPECHVFQPGEQLRVYAELRNFSSERHEANGQPAVFLTRLSSTAEIRDKDKKSVWKQPLQRDEPDRSQTPRHDYFDHYRFYLPDLRPGWYTLEVTVEDLATHRKARREVDLKVGLLPEGS
jgi:hypothetical protein